jgi:hypothetical protein
VTTRFCLHLPHEAAREEELRALLRELVQRRGIPHEERCPEGPACKCELVQRVGAALAAKPPLDELRLYLTANVDSAGQPREVFVHTADRSGWVSSLEAIAILISLALQHGVPLLSITSKLRDMHGRPAGRVRVPWKAEGYWNAKSLPDLLGAWLAWRFPTQEPAA